MQGTQKILFYFVGTIIISCIVIVIIIHREKEWRLRNPESSIKQTIENKEDNQTTPKKGKTLRFFLIIALLIGGGIYGAKKLPINLPDLQCETGLISMTCSAYTNERYNYIDVRFIIFDHNEVQIASSTQRKTMIFADERITFTYTPSFSTLLNARRYQARIVRFDRNLIGFHL